MPSTALSVLALLAAQAGTSPAPSALAHLEGRWSIVDPATGATRQACSQGQSFALTPDRRNVTLTDAAAPARRPSRYLVVHSEPERVLLFIEGETRRTPTGDPVLWWVQFDGPDRFQWRRYDWPRDARTVIWQRCRANG